MCCSSGDELLFRTDREIRASRLSAPNGMMYVYDRSDTAVNGHLNWQISAIDPDTWVCYSYI